MQIGLKSQAGARSATCSDTHDLYLESIQYLTKNSWGGEKSHHQSHKDSNTVPNSWCWWDKTALGLFNNAVFNLLWTKGNDVEPVESERKFKDKQLLPHNKAVNSVSHQWKKD